MNKRIGTKIFTVVISGWLMRFQVIINVFLNVYVLFLDS